MLPVIPPPCRDNLSDEEFYALGHEPMTNRIRRTWTMLSTLSLPRYRRGNRMQTVNPDAEP